MKISDIDEKSFSYLINYSRSLQDVNGKAHGL